MNECHACIQSTVVNPATSDDWRYSPLQCRGTLGFTFVVKYGFSVLTHYKLLLYHIFFYCEFQAGGMSVGILVYMIN